MHSFPHTYLAEATGKPTGTVAASSTTLPQLETAPPPQFDGPTGLWSPETLLCAAMADCFVLTFRGVCRAARFDWLHLRCRVEGTLERTEGQTRFTHFATDAHLTVPADGNSEMARQLLERAESACLVANSLRGTRTLHVEILLTKAAVGAL